MADTSSDVEKKGGNNPIRLSFVTDSVFDCELGPFEVVHACKPEVDNEALGDSNTSGNGEHPNCQFYFLNCSHQLLSLDIGPVDVGPGDKCSLFVAALAGGAELNDHLVVLALDVCVQQHENTRPFPITHTSHSGKSHEHFIWLKSDCKDDNLYGALIVGGNVELWTINGKSTLHPRVPKSTPNITSEDKCIAKWLHNTGIESPSASCIAVNYSPDGTQLTLAAGTRNGLLIVLCFVYCDFEYRFTSERLIPVFSANINSEYSIAITSIDFFPDYGTTLLALGCYSGDVLIWNLKGGSLEGEVATYKHIARPINSLKWSSDTNFIFVASTSGFCIDWLRKTSIASITPERLCKRKLTTKFEPICWSVAISPNALYMGHDDGLFLNIPLLELNNRNYKMDNIFCLQWFVDFNEAGQQDEAVNSSRGQFKSQANVANSDVIVDYLKNKFSSNMDRLSKLTIVGTRGNKRNKLYNRVPSFGEKLTAIHWIKSVDIMIQHLPVSVVAYGGNLGIVHLMVRC